MKIQLSSILPTGQVLSTGERFLLKKLAALRCPSSNRGFKLRLVKDKSDFVRIHGATCLTSLPAFSPWSYSVAKWPRQDRATVGLFLSGTLHTSQDILPIKKRVVYAQAEGFIAICFIYSISRLSRTAYGVRF